VPTHYRQYIAENFCDLKDKVVRFTALHYLGEI